MANTEPQYRQVETVKLAPDAVIFINGSDTIKDDNGDVYEIRNDITSINVSLSIDSVPGTANFSISLPDHSIRRFGDRRYNALKVFSEVEIYMKGRFPRELADGSKNFPYYPTFWGIITSITESYSDGMHTIGVSCADMLRWWQITQVVINPSLASSGKNNLTKDEAEGVPQKDAQTGREVSIWGNIFADANVQTILVELAKTSIENIAPLSDALNQTVGPADKINGDLNNITTQIENEIIEYWGTRLGMVGRSLKIYGIDDFYDDEFGRTIVKLDPDSYGEVKPYVLDDGSSPVTQSVTRSKLDIANELKNAIQFEFYMDVNGEIIFKPPFYNLDVSRNLNSIIRDVDIVSWSFNQSEAELYSRMDVKGNFVMNYSPGDAGNVIKGVAIDFNLAKKIGIRVQERNVSWLTNSDQCFRYAQAELNRINALAGQGSVVITGRPEIRLGYPIYVPSRDAFYYVKSIDHSFQFGGSFQTTLSIVAERRKLKDNQGNYILNGVYRNVGELEDPKDFTEGTSVVDNLTNICSEGNVQYSNYISDAYNPCIPTRQTFSEQKEARFTFKSRVIGTEDGDWSWINGSNIADDDLDNITQYRFTDKNGYEIIPFFKYAKDIQFKEQGTLETVGGRRNELSAAAKAQNLKPSDLQLLVNPNNVSLTLDDTDASMLLMDSKDRRSIAKRAQEVNPVRAK